MDLLSIKRGSPAAGPVGRSNWTPLRSGASTHGKMSSERWRTLFDLSRLFNWKEEAGSCIAPLCGQKVNQQPGSHCQAEYKDQNVLAEK
jgi:hypothetical protein